MASAVEAAPPLPAPTKFTIPGAPLRAMLLTTAGGSEFTRVKDFAEIFRISFFLACQVHGKVKSFFAC